MNLSFSIVSRSSSSSSLSQFNPTKIPDSFDTHHGQAEDSGGAATEDGCPGPQFVTVHATSKTLASDAQVIHVIPPIPNVDIVRPLKKIKNLLPPPPLFVLDASATDLAADGIPYGLSLPSSGGSTHSRAREQNGVGGRRRYEPAEFSILRRFHEDMENLPDDRGFDEFADIPVEGFGAALLAGYGWSEGKGIGRNNKGDTKIFQCERSAGTAGLGYVPSPTDPKGWKRKGHGVAYEKNKPKANSEEIVRVISGCHVGLKGKVVERSESSGIALKLLWNGDVVRVGEDMVAELGSVEEERCLKKLKELEIEEKRGRDEGANQADGSQRKSSRCGIRCLTSHIRVRIISLDFRGGKLYKEEGKVVDVVSPTTCDISLDENRELVQGVDQEILEAVLPQCGGSVLVLHGKHKGVFGSLVERDMEEGTGVVRDADNHALINVRLDQLVEYVGDPSYIGY